MNIINVYIETDKGMQQLDLFPDETLSINSSVQNIKDVSKVFTDFSRQFNVPPSNSNNSIFKHYYNVDVRNGFNAQKSVNAVIEVNNLPYKKGKMKLIKVNLEQGAVESYQLVFLGALVKLTDLFGEDEIGDIDLSDQDHAGDFPTVSGLLSGSQDVFYPLIARENNWRWDLPVTSSVESDIDIQYDTQEGQARKSRPTNGIPFKELRPAVRLLKVVEGIEQRYGINFSNDFFTSGSHFNDLFIYCNRENKAEDKLDQTGFDYELINIPGRNPGARIDDDRLNEWLVWLDGPRGTRINGYDEVRWELKVTPDSGFENVNYSVMLSDSVEYTGLSGSQAITPFSASYNGVSSKSYINYKFKPEEYFEFNAELTGSFYRRNSDGSLESLDTKTYGPQRSVAESNIVHISNTNTDGNIRTGILPKIKVKDFINGLVNMFNLVIDPIDDTNFKVQTLDDWYLDGNIYDISNYVDTSKIVVKRPDLPSSIEFKFAEGKDVISKSYRNFNDRGYGDLILGSSERGQFDFPDYDGKPLKIEIPFENPVGTMLENITTGLTTQLHCVKLLEINKDNTAKTVETKPIIFYANYNYELPGTGFALRDEDGKQFERNTYNVVKQTNSLENSTINNSLNFGVERDTFSNNGSTYYTPVTKPSNNLQYSLYANFWEDYITDLYNPIRRVFEINCVLPIAELTKLRLQDKLVINDRRYVINKLNTDPKTGEVKFELLNDIYSNFDLGILHAKIDKSSARLTCASPEIVLNGGNSTGFGVTYSWFTSGGNIVGSTTNSTAVIDQAGEYTLVVTDQDFNTDNISVTIEDIRTTPVVTLSASSLELNYLTPQIIISSSITEGYTYSWTVSGSNGNIVDGLKSPYITVDQPGTYELNVYQNNTWCNAFDNITITEGDLDIPSTPIGLHATQVAGTYFTLNWEDSTDSFGIQNYDVYLDNSYYTTAVVSNQQITGLISGSVYKTQVLSRDNSGYTSSLSQGYYQIAGDTTTGEDGIAVFLTNEAHTFTAVTGSVSDLVGSEFEVRMFKGGTQYTYDPTATYDPSSYRVENIRSSSIEVTLALSGSQAVLTPSSVSGTSGYIDVDIIENATSLTYKKRYSFSTSEGPGLNAKTNNLIASAYVITYDAAGVESPAQSITLTGTSINHSGTVYYDFLKDGVSKQNTTSSTYIIPDGEEPGVNLANTWTLVTREGGVGQPIIATDKISIYGIQPGSDGNDGTDGDDGFTVFLTNDSHVYPASSTGVVDSGDLSAGLTEVRVYKGSQLYTYDNTSPYDANSYRLSYLSSVGISVSTSTVNNQLRGTPTAVIADTGTSIYYLTDNETNTSFEKTYTFSKSYAGGDGTDGTDGIDGVDGISAKSNRLNASAYVITYNDSGVETPAQSITLTGTAQNHQGTVYYEFKRGDVTKQNSTTSTYTVQEVDEPAPNFTNTWTLITRENSTSSGIIATDTISLYGVQDGIDGADGADGSNGYTVVLLNEAHVLPVDNTEVVNYQGSGTGIRVYEGSTRLNGVLGSASTGEYTVTPTVTLGSVTVGTETIDVNGNTEFGNVSNAGVDPILINFRIAIGGTAISIDKLQSITRVTQGLDGASGLDGSDGEKNRTAFVYYQVSQANQPATPSATSFNFLTSTFSNLTTNWSTSPPTATGGEDYWYSSYTVDETFAGSNSGLPSFTSANKSFAFTELVTFTNLASTTGSTVINGGNITTGDIKSNNYVVGTSPYSSAGMKISLLDGSIATENFGITSLGDLSITGDITATSGKIGDWIIDSPSIKSVEEFSAGVPKVELNGTSGKITLKSNITTYTSAGGSINYDQTILLDPDQGRLEASHTGNGSQSSGISIVDSKGIFANFAGQDAVSAVTGIEIKGAIVGLGFGKMAQSAFGGENAIVGVFGNASNSYVGNKAPAFGGYFVNLFARGLYYQTDQISSGSTIYYVPSDTVFVVGYNVAGCTVYLPPNPIRGRVIEIKRTTAILYVDGNGTQLLTTGPTSSQVSISDGDTWRFIFDGSYWMANKWVS